MNSDQVVLRVIVEAISEKTQEEYYNRIVARKDVVSITQVLLNTVELPSL